IEQADEDGNVNMALDQTLANKAVKFGCVVSSFEVKTTKQQKKFAVGRLEDRAGTVSFSLYANAYEKFSSVIAADAPVKVSGKIDLRDESEPKINVDYVELWQNGKPSAVPATHQQTEQSAIKSAAPEEKAKGVLYVLVNSTAERDTVSDVLKLYEGITPCQAQITYDGKPRLMQFPKKVRICDELLARLSDLLGSNRVRYVEKKS
ncbi:MAG: hypothetical protein K2M36_03050, partial [Clostridia bacterium]|nr:hypothetical protein [Clostridia bacterium]